ncbi:MAG: hypothetical protein JSV46_11760 [Candidatus Aminicenantes bacterium]|nr:MAG: hypothetical protein JSV46_11760 [Candidatus Aminicenantes bacterium]
MRKKICLGVVIFLFVFMVFIPHNTLSSKDVFISRSTASHPQNIPDKKPKYDYMSTFLNRSTNPLGLKIDPELEKLLKQPGIKWAIRAGSKHVLD